MLHYRLVDLHWMYEQVLAVTPRGDLFIHRYYTFLASASAMCTDLLVHSWCWAGLDSASPQCTDRQLSWLTGLGRSNQGQPEKTEIAKLFFTFFSKSFRELECVDQSKFLDTCGVRAALCGLGMG